MIRLGRGHSGAHLTLLFSIEDNSEDPLFQGSLGVGICLEDGVEAFAKGEEGDYKLEVDFVKGTGDGKYVLGAEKKSQGYWGYHNRMYLPQSPKLYADASANYDMITLTFNKQSQGHSNPWLFTGENVINIAVKDGSTNTNFDAAFGINLDGSASETVIYGKYNA